jgi:hypothetical protein
MALALWGEHPMAVCVFSLHILRPSFPNTFGSFNTKFVEKIKWVGIGL